MDKVRVVISDPSYSAKHHILQRIHDSFLDQSYQTNVYWRVANIKTIDACHLKEAFRKKKLELQLERPASDLGEDYLFTCYNSNEHINEIAQQGLLVQQSRFNFLGDSLLGVILCKHADVQLKAAQNDHQERCWLMVFKVMCGRKLAVHPAGNLIRGPTFGADCHVSSIPPLLGETLGCQAIKSQVYLYEVDRSSSTGFSPRPRQCVPEAFVEFVSNLSSELPMPMLTVPHQGVQKRTKKSSSGSASSALGSCHPSAVVAGSGDQHSSYQQGFPRKSIPANLNEHQNVASNFLSLFAQNSLPSHAVVANPHHVIPPQRIPNRLGTTDGTLSSVPVTVDGRHSLLTVCQNLVIKLLQNFAKEMNGVASSWRAGCTTSNTPGLLVAVTAVQELRQLFQHLAPVCQQLYKFVDDTLTGRRNDLPNAGVIQEQINILNTCNSTMSCVFNQYHMLLEQNVDSVRKGGMLVQAVLSTKHLLKQCLTVLLSSLSAIVNTSFNYPQLNSLSGIGSLPVAGPSLPQEPRFSNVSSNLSPSLASLFAMSGDPVIPPQKHGAKSTANIVNKSNEFLQQHVGDLRTVNVSSTNVHSFQANVDNSCVNFGLRVPIVIAPDDSLIDEVVNMDVKPLDKENEKSVDRSVRLIKQEEVEVVCRKSTRQTVFIDADEITPESLIYDRPIKIESGLDTTAHCASALDLEVGKERNSAVNLVKVYHVSSGNLDENQGNNDQLSSLTAATVSSDNNGEKLSSEVIVEPSVINKNLEQLDQTDVMSPCILDLSVTHSERDLAMSGDISASKDGGSSGVLQKPMATTVLKKLRLITKKRELGRFNCRSSSKKHVHGKDFFALLCIKKAKLYMRKTAFVKPRSESCKMLLRKSLVIKMRSRDKKYVHSEPSDLDLKTASSTEMKSSRSQSFQSGVTVEFNLDKTPDFIERGDDVQTDRREKDLLLKNETCAIDSLPRPLSMSPIQNAISSDSVDIPVSRIKIEPALSECGTSLTEQLPSSHHQPLDADIIAEVIASSSEFAGNDEEETTEESGCLKIKIENVCSIASIGFDSINSDNYFKEEHEIIQTRDENLDDFKIAVASPWESAGDEHSGDISVKANDVLGIGSPSPKEKITPDDEFVDVGDIEYSLAVKSMNSGMELKVDDIIYKKEESQFGSFDDSDVEVDVCYENASDANDSDFNKNEGDQIKATDNDLENSEVLKFYSLGGDTYETADVHSALKAMSHNVTRKAFANCSNVDSTQSNQGKNRKRRKRSAFNARTKRKSKISGGESKEDRLEEKSSDDPVLDDSNRDCCVRKLIHPVCGVKPTQKRIRRRAQKDAASSASQISELGTVTEDFLKRNISSNSLSDTNTVTTLSDCLNSGNGNLCTYSENSERVSDTSENLRSNMVRNKSPDTKASVGMKESSCDGTSTSLSFNNQESDSSSKDLSGISSNQNSVLAEYTSQEILQEAIPDVKKPVSRRRRTARSADEPVRRTRLRSSKTRTSKDSEPSLDSSGLVSETSSVFDKLHENVMDIEHCVIRNTDDSFNNQELQHAADEDIQNVSENDCQKTSINDEDSFLSSCHVDSVLDENVSDVQKPKRRKKRYAMTGRPKRRKKSDPHQRSSSRIRKNSKSASATNLVNCSEKDVDSVEKQEDFNADLNGSLPTSTLEQIDTKEQIDTNEQIDIEESAFADVQNLVHNLFVNKSVTGQNEFLDNRGVTSSKRLETHGKTLQRKRKRKRKRGRSVHLEESSCGNSSTLLDMLNDNNFLETLKSAVKTVDASTVKPVLDSTSGLVNYTDKTNVATNDFENLYAVGDYCRLPQNGHFEAYDGYQTESGDLFHRNFDDLNSSEAFAGNAVTAGEQISYDSVLDDSVTYDKIRSALETIASRETDVENISMEAKGEIVGKTNELSIPGLDHHENSVSELASNLNSESFSAVSTLPCSSPVQTSTTGSLPLATKTVIPLSVYLKNVREANYKQMKSSEGNCTTPAFYTGVVQNPFEGQPLCLADGKGHSITPASIRDPRVARIRSQSTDLHSYEQKEPYFVSKLQQLLAEPSPTGESILYQEDLTNHPALAKSVPPLMSVSIKSRPVSFNRSFGLPLDLESSRSTLTKPVCSISPFMYKPDKPACGEEETISESKEIVSKKDLPPERRSKCLDGFWRLLPISNLSSRPPIIFAQLPLSERKIVGFPSDPRTRCDRDLSIYRQLKKPDNLRHDARLIIDDTDAAKIITSKSRVDKIERLKAINTYTDSEPSKEKNVSLNSSQKGDQPKFETVKKLENRHLKSPQNHTDVILQDLLTSIESGAYETEMSEKKKDTSVICGLNKDRVLGNRSYISPNMKMKSERLKKCHRSKEELHNVAPNALKRSDHLIKHRKNDSKSNVAFDKNIERTPHQRDGERNMNHRKDPNMDKHRRQFAEDSNRTSEHHKKYSKQHVGNSDEDNKLREKSSSRHLQKEVHDKISRNSAAELVNRHSDAEMKKSGEHFHRQQNVHEKTKDAHKLEKEPLHREKHSVPRSSHDNKRSLNHHENRHNEILGSRIKNCDRIKTNSKDSMKLLPRTVDASDNAAQAPLKNKDEEQIMKVVGDCKPCISSCASQDGSDCTVKVHDIEDDKFVASSAETKIETTQNIKTQDSSPCHSLEVTQDPDLLGKNDKMSEVDNNDNLESGDVMPAENLDESNVENPSTGEDLMDAEDLDQSFLIILDDETDSELTDHLADRDLLKSDSVNKENSSAVDLKHTAEDAEFPDCMQESFPLPIRKPNQSNVQIRAEILKSIQSLKLSLEDKLKSAVTDGAGADPWNQGLDVDETPETDCGHSSPAQELTQEKHDVLVAEKEVNVVADTDQNTDGFHNIKRLKTDATETQVPIVQADVVSEADKNQKPGSSDILETKSSGRLSSSYRTGRSPWKVANEWSNISSQWTEMSKDFDFPIHSKEEQKRDPVTRYMRLLCDIPADALAAYKEVIKREIAVTEQKIVAGKTFFDPFAGLNESQIKMLIRAKSTSPSRDREIRLECDILVLDKELSQAHEIMEEIKAQLSRHPSSALDKTYLEQEQRYNFLNVKMDMYQSQRSQFQRFQKSNFVHTVPDEFLFTGELEQFVSSEGMLLFLSESTISAEKCIHLSALRKEIQYTLSILEGPGTRLKDDVKRLKIKLGWLHLQRKLQFQEICCTTKQGQIRLMENFKERIISYRTVLRNLDGRKDPQIKDIQKFVHEMIYLFESYVKVLNGVEKYKDGGWRFTEKNSEPLREQSGSLSRPLASSSSHPQGNRNFTRPWRKQQGGANFSRNFDYIHDLELSESNESSYYERGPRLFVDDGSHQRSWNFYKEECFGGQHFESAQDEWRESLDYYGEGSSDRMEGFGDGSDRNSHCGSSRKRYRDHDRFKDSDDPTYSCRFPVRGSDRTYGIRDYSDLDYNNHEYSDCDSADNGRRSRSSKR